MNQLKSRSGPLTVAILFLGMAGLTYLLTYSFARHPFVEKLRAKELLPVIRCIEIIDEETIRIEDTEGEQVLSITGITSPLKIADLLSANLDPEHEAKIARKVLLTWIFRKRIDVEYPPNSIRSAGDEPRPAYVQISGVDVGGRLIKEGQVGALKDPHPRLKQYLELEAATKLKKKGIWR